MTRLTFGDIIKHWRGVRRFSQLALSAESGLSSRHISFLETGRSRPSRGSVLTLTRVLDMPKPAVNNALRAAGLAPEYPNCAIDDSLLEPVSAALAIMLENHEPYPALIIDEGWNMVGANQAALQMVSLFNFNGSASLVDALLNDDPEDPVIVNWTVIAGWTLLRLQNEISRDGENEALRYHFNRLSADPRLRDLGAQSFADTGPVLNLQIKVAGQVLTFFTMLAEFSTVQDVSMSERRVELFFPGDEITRSFIAGAEMG